MGMRIWQCCSPHTSTTMPFGSYAGSLTALQGKGGINRVLPKLPRCPARVRYAWSARAALHKDCTGKHFATLRVCNGMCQRLRMMVSCHSLRLCCTVFNCPARYLAYYLHQQSRIQCISGTACEPGSVLHTCGCLSLTAQRKETEEAVLWLGMGPGSDLWSTCQVDERYRG